MNNKQVYEKTREDYIKILEDDSLDIEQMLEKIDIADLIQKVDIYQAELHAQNDELLEKEYQLVKEKLKYQSLFQEAPIAYLILDISDTIINYNMEVEKIFDNKKLKIIPKFIAFLTTDSKKRYLDLLMQLRSKEKVSDVLEYIKDDKTIYGFTTIKKDSFDDIYLVSILDITKQKEQESLVFQQSKASAMGEMLSLITHQWKQPLSVISTISTSLDICLDSDNLDKDILKEQMGHISEQISYMNDTINDFKDFYSQDIKEKVLSISDCINKAMRFTHATIHNANIIFDVDFEDTKECKFLGYNNDLCQILITIITNAKDELVKKDGDRKIHLKVDIDDKNIYFYIKNNAGMIPYDIIEKIFDRNFTTKSKDNGSGLGLFIVRKIVDEHLKGKIEVRNIKDENSVMFILSVPIYKEK